MAPYRLSRRDAIAAGLAALGGARVTALARAQNTADPLAQRPAWTTIDGSTQPFPLPWLDKNGSHNQSPGPRLDPSNIFHFSGRVARANNFTGVGTDNAGRRLAFGTPSTDFSFMSGRYFSGRQERTGAFTHI